MANIPSKDGYPEDRKRGSVWKDDDTLRRFDQYLSIPLPFRLLIAPFFYLYDSVMTWYEDHFCVRCTLCGRSYRRQADADMCHKDAKSRIHYGLGGGGGGSHTYLDSDTILTERGERFRRLD